LQVLPEATVSAEPRRGSLVTVLGLVGKAELSNAEIKPLIGVDADLRLSTAEAAVWLYRDLMAKALTKK